MNDIVYWASKRFMKVAGSGGAEGTIIWGRRRKIDKTSTRSTTLFGGVQPESKTALTA